MSDIATLLSTFDFSIVACVFLAIYVKKVSETYREDFNNLHDLHKKESLNFIEAINKNSLVLEQLIERMRKEDIEE